MIVLTTFSTVFRTVFETVFGTVFDAPSCLIPETERRMGTTKI